MIITQKKKTTKMIEEETNNSLQDITDLREKQNLAIKTETKKCGSFLYLPPQKVNA